MIGERSKVTVLFADLLGSMEALAEGTYADLGNFPDVIDAYLGAPRRCCW